MQIHYESTGGGGSTVNPPTFNPVSGTKVVSGTVVHLNAADGATIRYISGTGTFDAPTTTTGTVYNDAEGVIVDADHNTIKAIAIVNSEVSDPATATYTVLNPLTTMDQIMTAATTAGNTATDAAINFGDWIVSGVTVADQTSNVKRAFVTDGTKGFVIYNSGGGLTFEKGQVLSGTKICQVRLLNGAPCVMGLNASDFTITQTGQSPIVTNTTISALTEVNTGSVVDLGVLTWKGSYFEDNNENKLTYYNTMYTQSFTTNQAYNVKGVFVYYSGNTNPKEIAPRDENDITATSTFTVTYNGNGADGGTTPVDNNQYASGETVTVLDNTFTKIGHEFYYWSDMQDGNAQGANLYDPTDNAANTFSITENTILYAQWGVKSYSYTLNVTGDDTQAEAALNVGGQEVQSGAIEYGAEVTVVVATNPGYLYSIAVKDANNQDVTVVNDKFTMPASAVTVTVTTVLIQNYTVSFNPGTGTCETASINESVGTVIQLPTAVPSATCVAEHWVFAGWATENVSETTTAPALLTGDYTITSNITLYAVYAVSSDVVFNFEAIASANDWSDGTAYTEVVVSPVTITANGGGNNGKYYVSDKTWRMYNGGSVSIECANGNVISVASDPSIDFVVANGVASFAFTATTKFKSITVAILDGSATTYNSNPNCMGTVENPEFSPVGGTYDATQSVTITCATVGATIQYKTNENGDWTNYTDAISVSTTTTIWAKAIKEGMYDSEVVSATYTIVEPFSPFTCTKATNIVSGKHYIITNGDELAMGYQKDNNRDAVAITLEGNVATVGSQDVYEFVIIGPDVDGLYTIYDVANSKYLYAASSSANQLKIQDNIDDNSRWNITFDATDGFANIIATKSSNRNKMQYNGTSNNSLFSCYKSDNTSYSNVYLYAKDNEATISIKRNDIVSYGTSERGGYYLIASPVGQVTPAAGNGFLTNNYDLYAFDQSASNAEVWRNYEATNFNLVSGRGYLYANSGNTTELTFEGMPYVGNGQVILSYDGDSDWAGWNLIGNPYATNATIPGNQSYYTLNTNRDELIAGESTTIGAMEGIFVKATAAGESVTFTPTSGNKGDTDLNSRVVLNLNGKHGVIDRAIVRFSEGGVLPKFMMNPENTRIYIRQDNEDFAVLNSNGQGEMPVNFKAAENGTYTISVEAENLDVQYLHLIDNMTGANIDLLATPSYTFEARKSDIASRFRLVFDANTGNNETNDNFAFINNGELIVNGNGTVQVIDILGRQMFSHEVNSAFRIQNSSFAPGVYVLRLVNGNDVKTQKIVIK